MRLQAFQFSDRTVKHTVSNLRYVAIAGDGCRPPGPPFMSVLELAISQPVGQSVVPHPIVPVIHAQHQVSVLQPS